jgi:hypothetical protein
MNKKLSLLIIFIGIVFLTACINSTAVSPQVQLPSQTSATQTSLPPATATMTLTPVPTFTSTPVPLFFTEEFNTDMSAWTSFQTGGAQAPTMNLENDSLRIDFSSPETWYYAIHNAHEYSNVFVSTKFAGTPSGSIGVICYYSESNGWYEFNLASDGTYGVLFGQWLAPGIAKYTPIITTTTEYLQIGNLNYEIGLTCEENILLLHINGKLFRKLDVTHYGLTEGKIGITASSFTEIPMTAVFDWVKVSEPSQ